MKLRDKDGGYFEAREVIAYDVLRDAVLVRHDTRVGADEYTHFPPEGTGAWKPEAVRRAELVAIREQAGVALGNSIRLAGRDNSEATAPAMPDGLPIPHWAK